jgi:hypothetical protein
LNILGLKILKTKFLRVDHPAKALKTKIFHQTTRGGGSQAPASLWYFSRSHSHGKMEWSRKSAKTALSLPHFRIPKRAAGKYIKFNFSLSSP